MYDIDRFVKEDVAVIFNTKEEMKVFHDECIKYDPSISSFSDFANCELNNTYVICWNGDHDLTIKNASGRRTNGNIEFFSKYGWKIIDVCELSTITLPSKDILMEFLGE